MCCRHPSSSAAADRQAAKALVMANIQNPLDACLHPPNGTRQPPPPSHPSKGGNQYSDDFRRQVLQMYFENYDLCGAPGLIPLRAAKKNPCYFTCVNWIHKFHATGDICLKRAVENCNA
jgi:hypothetical protein